MNPFKKFEAIAILSGETGHTYDEYDQVSRDMNSSMNQLLAWYNVDFLMNHFNNIDTNQNFCGVHLKEFYNFHKILDKYYLNSEKWKDQNGNAFKIRFDKPIMMTFGKSEIFKNYFENEIVDHSNYMYCWIDGDLKNSKQIRKIKLIKNNINQFENELKLDKLPLIPVTYQTKVDTIKLVEKYIEDKDECKEILDYYNNVPSKPIPTDIQKKIKKGNKVTKIVDPDHIETVLLRRKQWPSIMINDEPYSKLPTVKSQKEKKKNQKEEEEKAEKENEETELVFMHQGEINHFQNSINQILNQNQNENDNQLQNEMDEDNDIEMNEVLNDNQFENEIYDNNDIKMIEIETIDGEYISDNNQKKRKKKSKKKSKSKPKNKSKKKNQLKSKQKEKNKKNDNKTQREKRKKNQNQNQIQKAKDNEIQTEQCSVNQMLSISSLQSKSNQQLKDICDKHNLLARRQPERRIATITSHYYEFHSDLIIES